MWTRLEPWAGADCRVLLARIQAGEEPRPPVPGGGPRRCCRGWGNAEVARAKGADAPVCTCKCYLDLHKPPPR
jgi:hypothetical protein